MWNWPSYNKEGVSLLLANYCLSSNIYSLSTCALWVTIYLFFIVFWYSISLIRLHFQSHSSSQFIYIIYIYVCVCIYICIYICVYMSNIYIYIYMCVCVCICMCVYICVCVFVCIYIYVVGGTFMGYQPSTNCLRIFIDFSICSSSRLAN